MSGSFDAVSIEIAFKPSNRRFAWGPGGGLACHRTGVYSIKTATCAPSERRAFSRSAAEPAARPRPGGPRCEYYPVARAVSAQLLMRGS